MTTTPAPSVSATLLTGTATGPFPTGFKYAEAADVRVYLEFGGVRQPDLTAGSDYTLTGATPLADGGTVTLSAGLVPEDGWATGDRVVIRRRTVKRQALSLPDSEGHKPRSTEKALDRQMRIAEEQQDVQDRALSVPVGEAGLEVPAAAVRAGAVLAFDEDGALDLTKTVGQLAQDAADLVTAPALANIDAREDVALAAVAAQQTTSVAAVNAAGAGQVAAVVAAGDGKLTAIATAGDAELLAIGTAGGVAVDAVEAEGAAQVANVAQVFGARDHASNADALSDGVVGLASLVGGTGGTNGTFALAFSGGGGSGAAGVFVVAGGIVVSTQVTASGRGYTSAPTVSFAASAGLTGASATAVLAQNRPAGTFWRIKVTNGWEVFENVAGTATSRGTYPTKELADAALGLALMGPSGTLTNGVGTSGYDSITRTLVGLSAVSTRAGFVSAYEALGFEVPPGGKVTVHFRGTGTGSSPRLSLLRPGAGVISATPNVVRTDATTAITLTNTHATLAATQLNWDNNGPSTWEIVRVVLRGDLAETTPTVAPLVNSMMGILALMSRPVTDATARGAGLLIGGDFNTSMDTFTVNGLGDLTFIEASGSASYARSPITTRVIGDKVAIWYRAVPIDANTPIGGVMQASLEYGGGAASTAVNLNLDGGMYPAEFTATQAATRILWNSSNARFRLLLSAVPGSATDLTPAQSGTQAAILQLARIAAGPVGSESWTEPDKDIFWPSDVAFVAGRRTTIYGRQILRARKRQFNLDVSLVSGAGESENHPGFSEYLTPQLSFRPEDLGGDACAIEVKDPLIPTQIRRKTWTRRIASAIQTGTVRFCMLGDSTAALGLNALRQRVNASGATFAGVGTLSVTAGLNYEGRAGWSTTTYLGKVRPASPANPFLKSLSVSVPAELAIITANPTLCFADDVSFGTGVRPSFAEDPSRASYSIFSWDHWRQNAAIALTGTEALIAGLGLGRNGTTSLTFVADNELAHVHMVEDFRTVFPNGTIMIVTETVGEANDTVNFLATPTAWRDRTAPLVAMELKNFDDRVAEGVWVIPAWAQQNAYAGIKLNAASATDPDTGTTTHTVNDVVHFVGQPAIQWAESLLGPVLYAHENA